MGKIIDVKSICAETEQNIVNIITDKVREGLRSPKFAVVVIGSQYASSIYVRNKINKAMDLGIEAIKFQVDEDEDLDKFKAGVEFLINDPDMDGVIIQEPYPDRFKEVCAELMAKPRFIERDIDGLSLNSQSRLYLERHNYVKEADSFSGLSNIAATPRGICNILKHIPDLDIEGKHVVIIGRGKLVGKPLSQMLENSNATVTLCHSKTKNIKEICQMADILICAVGKPHMVDKSYIKEGCIVLDAGINRDENNKLCGDANTQDMLEKCSYITSVPGGVGVSTVNALMINIVENYLKNIRG